MVASPSLSALSVQASSFFRPPVQTHPAPQLALTSGLVRAAAFQALLARARVRVFCLSPQFTNGGDRIEPWVVQGSRASSLRLMNLLRAEDLAARAPPR